MFMTHKSLETSVICLLNKLNWIELNSTNINVMRNMTTYVAKRAAYMCGIRGEYTFVA